MVLWIRKGLSRRKVRKQQSTEPRKETETEHSQEHLQEDPDSLSSLSWDTWNTSRTTSGSLGSLLLKLQKEEEEEMRKMTESPSGRHNNTASKTTPGLSSTAQLKLVKETGEEEEEEAVQNATATTHHVMPASIPMDRETVRELDESVMRVSRDALLQDIKVLERPSPSLYTPRTTTTTTTEVLDQRLLPLSMPSHYKDRIGRDMRHLAVSVASTVDETWQWRLFLEEKGGVVPLLQCIRDGVECIRQQSSESVDTAQGLDPQHYASAEEDFLAACTACRALRDLCAMSLEMSAVLTDGILRVEEAWSKPLAKEASTADSRDNTFRGALRRVRKPARPQMPSRQSPLSDFVALLEHANELEFTREARDIFRLSDRRNRREARRRCKLYVLQLLLAMAVSSDDAVRAMRATPGLEEAVLASSSYARTEITRRWLRYPLKVAKRWSKQHKSEDADDAGRSRPFIEAAKLGDNLLGQVQGTANQLLAAIGYNRWVPKIPGQRGLRILCIDGGGTRGMAAVTSLRCLVKAIGDIEVCDTFDMIVGTSTGAIIAFLVGLRKETSGQAKDRYNALIKKIFVKSALSTPLMLFTTATYDETPFMEILSDILQDNTMLDSRADPTVPLVFAVTSKMSSTPTHVCLFRNYNYAGGELRDSFIIDAETARQKLELPLDLEDEVLRSSRTGREREKDTRQFSTGRRISREASRYPGSFRVLQRHALRASTAAPTVFKPVFMGGEVYCDGGVVASNPAAIAIHEARCLFPDIPIEMVVSIGTGGFTEEKSAPRIGWDGIIGQIVNSATDGEQIHHLLEDILGGEGLENIGKSSVSTTKYYRLNPIVGGPNDFPIDGTDPKLLARLSKITEDYFEEPEQKRKLEEINDILDGRRGLRKLLRL